MNETTKILWLRRVLMLKILLCLFAWGLPALIGTRGFLALFGIQMPADPIFLRLFGAVITAQALLYYFAYRDPVHNVAVIKYAVLDNGLSTLVILIIALTLGLSSWFFWVSGVLTFLFFLAFQLLMPRTS